MHITITDQEYQELMRVKREHKQLKDAMRFWYKKLLHYKNHIPDEIKKLEELLA